MEYPGSVRDHHEFHITYMCAYMRVFLAKYPSVEQSRARISSIERKTRGFRVWDPRISYSALHEIRHTRKLNSTSRFQTDKGSRRFQVSSNPDNIIRISKDANLLRQPLSEELRFLDLRDREWRSRWSTIHAFLDREF